MPFIIKKIPCKTEIQFPVETLYTRAVLSALAVTNLVPIELKFTSKISSMCPVNVWKTCPLPMSHILHVLSIDPVAANSPENSN